MPRISTYGMGRRRRSTRRRGRGILDSLRSAHDFIKKNRLISTVGNTLGAVGVPYAGLIGKAAGVLGYGRRRRRPVRRRAVRRRRGGADLRSALASAHQFVKNKRLISGALKHFGHHRLSAAASALGYGRRRRVVHRRRRGGADLRSILSSAHNFVKSKRLISSGLRHYGHPTLAKIAHIAGYGRRRRVTHRRVRHRGMGSIPFSTEQIAVPRFT